MSPRDDKILQKFRITLEIGCTKNVNKNPVAKKAVSELEDELLRQDPGGVPCLTLGWQQLLPVLTPESAMLDFCQRAVDTT